MVTSHLANHRSESPNCLGGEVFVRRRRFSILELAAVVLSGCILAGFPVRGIEKGARPGNSVGQAAGGLIAGTVVASDTKIPIPNALVRLEPEIVRGVSQDNAVTPTGASVIADDSGRFVFRDVSAKAYRLTASAPGFAQQAVSPFLSIRSGQRLLVQSGVRCPLVELELMKLGSISGAVLDEISNPVQGVRVVVARLGFAWATGRLTVVAETTSDDRGQYRLGGLEPGRYMIMVPSTVTTVPTSLGPAFLQTAGSGSVEVKQIISQAASFGLAYAGSEAVLQVPQGSLIAAADKTGTVFTSRTTFYPSSTSAAAATSVLMHTGELVRSIDIVMRRDKAFHVSGRLTSAGAALANVPVALFPSDATIELIGSDAAVARTLTGADGRFALVGVPASDYLFVATLAQRPQSAGAVREVLWAQKEEHVAADVDGEMIALRAGSRLSGTIEVEPGVSNLTDADRQQMTVTPVPLTTHDQTLHIATKVASDNTFVTDEYPDGLYMFSVSHLRDGLVVTSATVGGRDVSSRPFELGGMVFGDTHVVLGQGSSVNGHVQAPETIVKRNSRMVVLVFPADFRSWIRASMPPFRSGAAVVSDAGEFSVDGLLPGEYCVGAVVVPDFVEPSDPEFVSAVAAVSTKVVLAARDTTTVSIKGAIIR